MLGNYSSWATLTSIMFDDSCHGLTGDEWKHLRPNFVPMDMILTGDMPRKSPRAISAYPKQIDGMLGMYEPILTVVVEAATLLGVSTSPLKSVATVARDKCQAEDARGPLLPELVVTIVFSSMSAKPTP
ncbi:hypothetical protein SBOR_0253 [Sclerotinia borealis F-4128]|uniref:Uncharacterized protein n=1 Tax=Sclerotinia borealis (strain F-4128) TaxID=1432307 RepID=W9CTD6_SCLBF|nr:hypothetical protein SBOR_0253 [Sclerotinia borealis F-4128]